MTIIHGHAWHFKKGFKFHFIISPDEGDSHLSKNTRVEGRLIVYEDQDNVLETEPFYIPEAVKTFIVSELTYANSKSSNPIPL